MFGYISEKMFSRVHVTESPESTESEFSTVKFVAIAASVTAVLFGMGYALYGLGSSLNSTAKIIDELCDSSESLSDSSERSSDSHLSNDARDLTKHTGKQENREIISSDTEISDVDVSEISLE